MTDKIYIAILQAAFDELHTEVLNVELVIIRVRDTVITARQIQRRLKVGFHTLR